MMANIMSAEKLSEELNKWITIQIEKGHFKNREQAKECLACDVMKCKSVKSIENYLYLNRYPMKPEHAKAINAKTKIKLSILNNKVW